MNLYKTHPAFFRVALLLAIVKLSIGLNLILKPEDFSFGLYQFMFQMIPIELWGVFFTASGLFSFIGALKFPKMLRYAAGIGLFAFTNWGLGFLIYRISDHALPLHTIPVYLAFAAIELVSLKEPLANPAARSDV